MIFNNNLETDHSPNSSDKNISNNALIKSIRKRSSECSYPDDMSENSVVNVLNKKNLAFNEFRKCEEQGIDLNDLAEFKKTFDTSINTVRHIGWHDRIGSLDENEENIRKLEANGFQVTYYEDYSLMNTFTNYT